MVINRHDVLSSPAMVRGPAKAQGKPQGSPQDREKTGALFPDV
jgi:hypothetical protein